MTTEYTIQLKSQRELTARESNHRACIIPTVELGFQRRSPIAWCQVGELKDIKEVNQVAVQSLQSTLTRIEKSAAKEPARRFRTPGTASKRTPVGASTPGESQIFIVLPTIQC